ncbi:MAG TPA: hypothetical protein VEW42_03055 [Candidatus Eisenbacteria bacterium]|nr:hypothetical protein [Candidatus Eisenbacteria bacterium]
MAIQPDRLSGQREAWVPPLVRKMRALGERSRVAFAQGRINRAVLASRAGNPYVTTTLETGDSLTASGLRRDADTVMKSLPKGQD